VHVRVCFGQFWSALYDVLCRQYCAEPHTAECVRVFSADGQASVVYPELPYRTETVAVDDINGGIGIKESADTIASLLTRMCLQSSATDGGQRLSIEVSDGDVLRYVKEL